MSKRILSILFPALFVLSFFSSQAQYKLSVKFCGDEKNITPEMEKMLPHKKEFNDSLSRSKELQKIIDIFRSQGFLSAGIDSLQSDSMLLSVCIRPGEKYRWLKLSPGNVDEGILHSAGYNQKVFAEKTIDYTRTAKLMEKILIWCENNGYPFASVRLDSIEMHDDLVTAQLNLSRNKLVKIDSIKVRGSASISDVYIQNYLGIKPGDLYNEALIRDIRSRVREIAFVSEAKPFDVVFTEGKARVELYLETKRASQFDLVVGIVPPPENTPGKYELTGDAHLKLLNSFSRGELIDLNWTRPQPLSQDLKVHFVYPFLFSTPFGADLFLSIYKQDTTYIDVVKTLGLQYIIHGNNSLKAFVSFKESDLLSPDAFQFATTLPSFADISTTQYGLALHAEKLDYRLNPRRGFSADADARIGDKIIHKNAELNQALYDSVQLRSTQYYATGGADYFFPIATQSTVTAGIKGGYQYSPVMFRNELFRIGGLKTVRGYDEQSIYCSFYLIGNLEYRFLLEQNSYLLAFINRAYFRDDSHDASVSHGDLLGFGAGITFETRLGIFSFIYALGRENQQVQFRNGKIHFGLISTF